MREGAQFRLKFLDARLELIYCFLLFDLLQSFFLELLVIYVVDSFLDKQQSLLVQTFRRCPKYAALFFGVRMQLTELQHFLLKIYDLSMKGSDPLVLLLYLKSLFDILLKQTFILSLL